MTIRAVAFLCVVLAVTSGCVAKREAEEREALLTYLYQAVGVATDPYGLAPEIKRQCHDAIRYDIISRYQYPESWEMLKDLTPMEKATHEYALKTGLNTLEPIAPETVFFMTEYGGYDFVGHNTRKQYVCSVERVHDVLQLKAVASREGFKRRTALSDTPPAAW